MSSATKIQKHQEEKRKLPDGWRWVKLGDLFDITSSKRVFQSEWKQEGVPFYRAREIVILAKQGFVDNELFISEEMFVEYSTKYGIPKEGDMMVTGVGTLGVCYVVQERDKFYFKDGNIIWLKKKSEADTRFVEYAFQTDFLREQIDDSAGATVGTFTIIKAKNTQIPLPPLPEQKRIAGVLHEQMAAVDKARSAAQARLEAVKNLPAAYLRQVFPQPGQPLPDGWRRVKLGDVCDGPGQYGTSTKSNGDQRGVPVLGMYHIHEGRIRWENVSYVNLDAEELPQYLLRKGDLLFNRTNSAELVGKTAVYDTDKAAVFASYLIRFRFFEGTADSYFVSAFINSREGRKFIEENMTRAIGQVNISASTMRMMPIPLPPLADQQRIAGLLKEQMVAVAKARAAAEDELNTINALPTALLRRVFNGEI
jgi:type I restriction enzyme S subunit